MTNGVATKYYYLGGQRVALNKGGALSYLHADHLGSTSIVTDASGNCTGQQAYYPYGTIRTIAPNPPCTTTIPTDVGFTGQRLDASSGLMYYGARYYDSALGRFVSADTVVPQAGNPQALNRYSYVGNNPLKYTDPSGHCWGVASGARSLPSYDVTCGNLDMALTIVQHPNANAAEKAFAGWYLAIEGTAHVSLVVGSSILAWQAIAPAAAAGEAACADGDCTNEVTTLENTIANASEKLRANDPELWQAIQTARQSMTEATRQQLIQGRSAYEAEVRGIANEASRRLSNGESLESVAQWAYNARRFVGIQYKELTPENIRDIIYARNIAKYGDALGPSFQYLLERGKTWEQIIESAARPDGSDLIPLILAPLE